MNIALLSMDGFLFALRWFHVFFGVIWIGLLYYFNFVQGPFFAETDAPTKSQAIQKLLPRALWWFRWGAMFTLITGILLVTGRTHQGFSFASSWGVNILTGMSLATVMWFNVWFIIWPNQKVVIASATQVAGGGTVIPEAAACAAKAGLASRTNVLFSIPVLFFMSAARNLNVTVDESSKFGLCAALIAIVILGLEFNAIKGKTGPLTTVKGVIHCGFALALVMYAIVEITL
ncbi:MAG: urate hydroxylase PuuD [Methylotenera sp.]|nr:urate hydroxylase PuuD [Oligoflexia bacterium]